MGRFNLTKYFYFRYHSGEVDPKSVSDLVVFVDFSFKLAEYALIVGVFSFFAVNTQHWAVFAIAGFLGLLFFLFLAVHLAGFHYFLWREAEAWWLKAILLIGELTLFIGVFYTLVYAFRAIFEAMKTGVGI